MSKVLQDPLYYEYIKVGTRVRTPIKGYGYVIEGRKGHGKNARPDILVEHDYHEDQPNAEDRQGWYNVLDVVEQ